MLDTKQINLAKSTLHISVTGR